MGDRGPIVDVRGRLECAGGVWDGDLGAVGAVAEGEELGVLLAVLGVDEVRCAPVDVVSVACVDGASDEAVGEVGVGKSGVEGVVFVEAVGEFSFVRAAEEVARLVGGEDVGRGVVFAASCAPDQLAVGVRCCLWPHERELAAVVPCEAV